MIEIITKQCTECGETKPATLEYFHKNKGCKLNLYPKCKICRKKNKKIYLQDNKKKIKEYNKIYRHNHKEYYKEYDKKYRQNNKKKTIKRNKIYYSQKYPEAWIYLKNNPLNPISQLKLQFPEYKKTDLKFILYYFRQSIFQKEVIINE